MKVWETQVWRAPNGQLHLQNNCRWAAPADRMVAERLDDEQMVAAGNVCRCAWNANQNARIRLAATRAARRRRPQYLVGRDHDPHELTSGFETSRRRH